MPTKLTQKEYEQRVFNCVGDKYTVISSYEGKNKPITLRCNKHNIIFTCTADCFMRGSKDVRSSCPECSKENLLKKSIELECDYCRKKFFRSPSKAITKSNLHFCCRDCKDKAQRIENNYIEMWPDHYKGGSQTQYRQLAFRNYIHECSNCGWDEDEDILEVHHIDENRENNRLENLMILCPTCHRKLTSHKYRLDGKNIIKL